MSPLVLFVGVSFTIWAFVAASENVPKSPYSHEQMPLGHYDNPLEELSGCAISISQQLASNQTRTPILDDFCEGSVALLPETDRAGFACEIGRLLFGGEGIGWIGMNSSNYHERASVNWWVIP
jgi:hypothetical protein